MRSSVTAESQPSDSISRGSSVGGPQTVTLAPIRVNARIPERATREWLTSPTIQMLTSSSVPIRRRSV